MNNCLYVYEEQNNGFSLSEKAKSYKIIVTKCFNIIVVPETLNK